MIFQLLPLDAHCHGTQLFIHAEVIGMLCKGSMETYGQVSRRRGHGPWRLAHGGLLMAYWEEDKGQGAVSHKTQEFKASGETLGV